MTHQPHRLLALAALLLTFNSSLGAVVNILPLNASWRYQTNNLDGSNWTQPAYNDAAWFGPGSALLYIETAALPAPKNTLLPANGSGVPWSTYYFRTTFVATNLPQLLSLTFSNLIDDGAVFYLNGVEVKRLRMNAGVITNASVSSATVGDATTYDVFTLQGVSWLG